MLLLPFISVRISYQLACICALSGLFFLLFRMCVCVCGKGHWGQRKRRVSGECLQVLRHLELQKTHWNINGNWIGKYQYWTNSLPFAIYYLLKMVNINLVLLTWLQLLLLFLYILRIFSWKRFFDVVQSADVNLSHLFIFMSINEHVTTMLHIDTHANRGKRVYRLVAT